MTFTPGDIAIKARGPCTDIPKGTLCRVVDVQISALDDGTALVLAEWPHGAGYVGWMAENFDKLHPATPIFVAEMRSLLAPQPALVIKDITAELHKLKFERF